MTTHYYHLRVLHNITRERVVRKSCSNIVLGSGPELFALVPPARPKDLRAFYLDPFERWQREDVHVSISHPFVY